MNKINLFIFSFLLCGLGFLNFTIAQTNSDDILGTWMVKGKNAKILIFKNQSKYYGKIIWTNNLSKKDHNNPDKNLRNNLIVGITNLRDFVYNKEEDKFVDGKIYDPLTGFVYSSFMILNSKNELTVRGFLGISLLGRSENWIRVVE